MNKQDIFKRLGLSEEAFEREHPDLNMASASTLPLAICLAALKVVAGEDK